MSALQGLKVLELGTLVAGPFAARIFGEFGAEVIKVEIPNGPDGKGGGDPIRNWRQLHEGNSLWWTVQARNKKSIALNLKTPQGCEIARKLALEADLVIENYRPGVLEKWGLDYQTLSKINPALIVVRLSGYGQTGPMRDLPAFGAIGEAMGGLRYVSGYPDRLPTRTGISIGDSLAALHSVIGALMALRHRDATGGRWNGKAGDACVAGQGQMVDVALYESVFNMMESLVPDYDIAGAVRERMGRTMPGGVPSNTYTTRDQQNIIIAASTDAIFYRLMHAIDRNDLAEDPQLAHDKGRVRRVSEIDAAIQAWCDTRTMPEVLDVLRKAAVPASKIYSVADIFTDPQFEARGMIEQCYFPDGRPVKLPAVVPKLSATPGGTRWVGPRLGEHTEEILQGLGYSAVMIAELAKIGVIGL